MLPKWEEKADPQAKVRQRKEGIRVTTGTCRGRRWSPDWPRPRLGNARSLDPVEVFDDELPLSAIARQVSVACDSAILAKGKKSSADRRVEAVKSELMSTCENGQGIAAGNLSIKAKGHSVIRRIQGFGLPAWG